MIRCMASHSVINSHMTPSVNGVERLCVHRLTRDYLNHGEVGSYDRTGFLVKACEDDCENAEVRIYCTC